MVEPIVACVTAGLSAPGEHDGSGSENVPEPVAWQEPGSGWGWTTLGLARETGSEAGRAASVRRCAGLCRRRGRAARRWSAVEVEPDVLVELADEELWVPQAGSPMVAMTAAAAAKNRRVGTPQP